jgi:8-oxo-dGTP diphosphatase
MNKFIKVGLVYIRDKKLLLCRPYAFDDLIMPGGQRDESESDTDCLLREIREELGTQAELDIDSLRYIGIFEDIAASYKEKRVEITLYMGEVRGELIPSSEIKELIWFSPSDDINQLSPIIRNKILPALQSDGFM